MNTDKVRMILNATFIVLALAAVITYFAAPDFKTFLIVCGVAIFVKLIEFMLRFLF